MIFFKTPAEARGNLFVKTRNEFQIRGRVDFAPKRFDVGILLRHIFVNRNVALAHSTANYNFIEALAK